MDQDVKKKLYGLVAVLTAVTLIGYAAFKTFLPEYYFAGFPYISLFYFILGTASIILIHRATRTDEKNFFRMYMAVKTMKLIALVIYALAYAVFARESIISFLAAFLAYYVIYSVYEARVSMKLKKN